ncbi:ribosome small subunit-dependent GTPase A [Candidatus Flexifilum breve]|uniref:ribosome small subunit-dependent GTPase A n=1 Tax=Candidatus Flexifilum breve TaxID=3140694 RepID=UPI0031CC772A
MDRQGLVVKEQSGFFWVEVDEGTIYMCRLRGKLREDAQASDIAAIGDRVQITAFEDLTGVVEAVEERHSVISRALRTEGSRGAGSPEREHVIIANADQALFVFAAAQPPPSLKLLDRFLVVGEKSGISDLIIVINKIDLADRAETEERFAPYITLGYPVIYTSALERIGVDALTDRLRGKISVFTGPSGVGKSSLLNAVEPGLGRAVKSVSGFSEEGVHTTRDSELVKLAVGGYLADTPGIRTLNIWDVEPEELDAYFREIAPYVRECRFRDCHHRQEPGCAVRRAVVAGSIHRSRYRSYVSLREELEEAYAIS